MARSYFRGHEADRFDALNGLPLAGFWQRGLGLAIDLAAGAGLWLGLEMLWAQLVGHVWHLAPLRWTIAQGLLGALMFCAVTPYVTNGLSVGKWITRTRVVSLLGPELGFWQCLERTLGYAVAILEGMGFLQYFWGDNRMCVHDRMAETVVLDLRKSALRIVGVNDEDALMELLHRH